MDLALFTCWGLLVGFLIGFIAGHSCCREKEE